MTTRFILLLIAAIACSTGAILIKASQVDPVLLAGFRCLLAAVILSPFFIRDYRRHRAVYGLKHLRATLLPGLFMGLHFITWNMGVFRTTVANATLLVTMVPITMPFFSWFMFRHKLNRAEWVATALSVAGVLILTGVDLKLSAENLSGDFLSLISLLLLTVYLVQAKVNRKTPSICLYVVPVYLVAGSFSLLVSLFFMHPVQVYNFRELAIIAALAIVPTVIGHSIFNYSMRHLPSQLVAIAGSSQFIFAGIMAYFVHDECPHWTFLAASILVVCGVVIAVRARPAPHGRHSSKSGGG